MGTVVYENATEETLRSEDPQRPGPDGGAYPRQAILPVGPSQMEGLKVWLDEWLLALHNSHGPKLDEWALEEADYEALPEPPKTKPYIGASNIVVPVIAMGVDPTFARLDTGLFANEIFQLKAKRKKWSDMTEGLQSFMNHYFRHNLDFRRTCGPCLLDIIKHGTGVLKTVYDCTKYDVKTYDANFKPIKKTIKRFEGPRVYHVPIQNFMFPPYYQHIEDCPIVAEIIYTTPADLQIAKQSGKVTNIDDVLKFTTTERSVVEDTQSRNANHEEARWVHNEIKLYEIWCRYDIDGDGLPESLVITYHEDTKTILQLRYNWYHHQRYPYTVIPYTTRSGSMYGLGQCKMMKPFQDAVTDWQQMAMDNNYLANVRGWVARTDSGIEEDIEWYPGKVVFVDDPSKDLKELKLSDAYASTLTERQNLLGLGEKRSGISDYLTGRESPIVGSRATATSTVALIQEGKARVESVLENVRLGLADVAYKTIDIWIQYGTGDIEDVVYGMDETADHVKRFFSSVSESNVRGAIGIALGASDPANNRSIQQQTSLAIIQVMMQYLEKVMQLGQQAVQAQATMPQLVEMSKDVMVAARKLFKDFLDVHEYRDAEALLPELEKYLNGPQGLAGAPQGGQGAAPAPGAGTGIPSGLPGGGVAPPQNVGTGPGPTGGGGGYSFPLPGAG